jgi:hypothetical protein
MASLWHAGAQMIRTDIFGRADPLRPSYETSGSVVEQVSVPAMGMVGPSYLPGSLAFVSVNPAGGKPGAKSSLVDDDLYRMVEQLRDARDESSQLKSFEGLAKCFVASMPTWTIWRQYLDPVLAAISKTLAECAYLYLVPFRTRGDAGSSLPDEFAAAGYARHLYKQLQLLRPGLVIAVDRPSERYSLKWAAERADKPVVFYFTRKRDAHAERKLLLAEIRSRFGA